MREDRILESSVLDIYHGLRIDQYLAKRFSYLSRSAWQKEIEEGRVLLNGAKIKVRNKKVSRGDIVFYVPSSLKEPEVDFNFTIIFENENYIAVNKSGNIPSSSFWNFYRNTLLSELESRFATKLYPLHRLDRETSGVVLFGKNAAAASAVQSDFSSVSKEYIAVVRGCTPEEWAVEVPIGNARNSLIQKKREAYPGAFEEALTHFKRLSTNGEFSLVRANPVTGRMHQIRVHLLYSGYPILGDKMYSFDETIYIDFVRHGNSNELALRAGFTRCALHSLRLEFFDRFNSCSYNLLAPLTEDLKELVENLDLKCEFC